MVVSRVLNVKGPDIVLYMPPLTGKPEQLWFTILSGILTSISSRQCSAISKYVSKNDYSVELVAAHCPNDRTFDLQSAARQIHLCPRQLQYVLDPALFCGNDWLFLVASITRYSFNYPGGMEGWVGPRTEVCCMHVTAGNQLIVDVVSCWICSMTGNGRRTLPSTASHRAALYEFHHLTASSFWRSNHSYSLVIQLTSYKRLQVKYYFMFVT